MKVLVMKNLSGNKKGNFEKEWQDAFEGKEMTPSPDVWMKVDGHLANQESKKYRKGIFFYKWTAAASLIVATAISLFYIYDVQKPSTDQISTTSTNQVESVIDNDTQQANKENTTIATTPNAINQKGADQSDNNATGAKISANDNGGLASVAPANLESGAKNANNVGNDDGNSTSAVINNPTNSIASNNSNVNAKANISATTSSTDGENNNNVTSPHTQFKGLALTSNANDETKNENFIADLGQKDKSQRKQRLEKLKGQGAEINNQIDPKNPDYLQKVLLFKDNPFEKDDNEGYDDLWAGVDVASGFFDPNFGSRRSNVDAQSVANEFSLELQDGFNANNRSVIQMNSGGQSLSFGFNMGKRIAKKWVLQGGLNYLNYTAQGRTNTFYELDNQNRTPAVADYVVTNAESLNFASSEISYDNQFQFLSIPVKAGFIVLDKKFGMIVSAGVGTDFWLKNRIAPSGNDLEDFTVTPGSDAPYRRLYFNGLLSTQFKYKFSKQYSITLEPAYAIAINSFSKSDSNLDSFPNVFNLGIGLKYHFK